MSSERRCLKLCHSKLAVSLSCIWPVTDHSFSNRLNHSLEEFRLGLWLEISVSWKCVLVHWRVALCLNNLHTYVTSRWCCICLVLGRNHQTTWSARKQWRCKLHNKYDQHFLPWRCNNARLNCCFPGVDAHRVINSRIFAFQSCCYRHRLHYPGGVNCLQIRSIGWCRTDVYIVS